jgi:hypothetical protein
MRVDDVPQEKNPVLAGHRKAMYAVDAEGRYTIVQSNGWEAEETVTTQAVEAYAKLAEAARRQVAAGETSPLEYHMYRCRMDLALLAQTTGLWQWRIRRHFRPAIFARLKPALLSRYADVLGMTVDDLRRVE